MPNDPRNDERVIKLFDELKTLEHDDLVERLHQIKDDDMLGWVRYRFQGDGSGTKPWQVIVINRWLERDKFFRNILPQWLGTAFGVLSFAVSVLALIVALNDSGR